MRIDKLEFHVSRVLPTVYDNTLSFYELVNKIANKLNDLIEEINDLFEGDMTDTIERILNEWALNGKLEELIKGAIKIPSGGGARNVVYVEDYFTEGLTDYTKAIQKALDDVKEGETLVFPVGTFTVSKNTELAGFPNGDQPCLLLFGKKNVRVSGYGCTLEVKTHAQGILEIQASENVEVEGLSFKGYGQYPNIDNVTGYGEKGTSSGGYDTSGFWGYRKNNSFDTTARVNPSTSTVYGTFGGGFIGNVGIGVLTHNGCKRITFDKCEATGFNYSGFQVGHLGDFVPTQLGYQANEHINYNECYSHDNYSANYYSMHSFYLKYEKCISENSGHPNASKEHTYVDPGYGYGMGGSDSAISTHTTIRDCVSLGDKRKGIDAHKGNGFICTENIVDGSWIGGIFYRTTNIIQRAQDFDISNNKIYNVGGGKNPSAPIEYSGVKGNDWSEDNILSMGKINHNTIKDCFGWLGLIEIGTFNNLEIIGNQIKDLMLPALRSNTTSRPVGIYFGYSLQAEYNYFGVCSNNIIDFGGFDVVGGIVVRNLLDGTISGNVFKGNASTVECGLRVWDCRRVNITGNSMTLGDFGKPYELARNDTQPFANDSRGGNPPLGATPLSGKTIHMRIEMTHGVPTITYWSGEFFVDSVVSHIRGVEIKLKEVQQGIIPQVHVEWGNATGMNSSALISSYKYPYQMTSASVIIALLDARGGTNIPYDTWNMGALNIYITI